MAALFAGSNLGFADTWYFDNTQRNNNNGHVIGEWRSFDESVTATSFNTTDNWVYYSPGGNNNVNTYFGNSVTIGDLTASINCSSTLRINGGTTLSVNSLTLDIHSSAGQGGFAVRQNGNFNVVNGVIAETDNTSLGNRYLAFGSIYYGGSTLSGDALTSLSIGGDVSLKNYTMTISTVSGNNAAIAGSIKFDTGSYLATNSETDASNLSFTQTIKVGGLESVSAGMGAVGSRGTNTAGTTRLGILEITGSGTYEFSGSVANTIGGMGGTTSIVMNGAGTQILSGANTYTGDTTVISGTLLVSSISSSSKVDLQGGAFGAVGDNALAIGNLEWSGGGFAFDLSKSNYTIIIADIDGTFDVAWLSDFSFAGINEGSYDLLGITAANSDFAAAFDGATAIFSDGGKLFDAVFTADENNLSVSFTLVPEPGTYAAIFGAVTLLFVVIRRKTRA